MKYVYCVTGKKSWYFLNLKIRSISSYNESWQLQNLIYQIQCLRRNSNWGQRIVRVTVVVDLGALNMSESENIIIHFLSNPENVRTWKCQNLKTSESELSELENVRILQNWKTSESENIRILQEWKMSESESVKILRNCPWHYYTPFKANRVENTPLLVCREENFFFSIFCAFLLFMYSKRDIWILKYVLYQYRLIYACIHRYFQNLKMLEFFKTGKCQNPSRPENYRIGL